MERLKIVILKAPYENWEHPEARDWFQRIVTFRREGYEENYRHPIIPLDTSDFMGTHVALCERRNGSLRPVLAYRTISLEQCQRYDFAYPGLSLARSAKSKSNEAAVAEVMTRHRGHPERLHFNAAWTIDPSLKPDRERVAYLKYLMLGLEYLLHEGKLPVEIMSAGVIRFKVPQSLSAAGFSPLTLAGKPVEPIPAWFLAGEPIQLILLREFTAKAREAAKAMRALWQDRLQIGSDHEMLEKIAA